MTNLPALQEARCFQQLSKEVSGNNLRELAFLLDNIKEFLTLFYIFHDDIDYIFWGGSILIVVNSNFEEACVYNILMIKFARKSSFIPNIKLSLSIYFTLKYFTSKLLICFNILYQFHFAKCSFS